MTGQDIDFISCNTKSLGWQVSMITEEKISLDIICFNSSNVLTFIISLLSGDSYMLGNSYFLNKREFSPTIYPPVF